MENKEKTALEQLKEYFVIKKRNILFGLFSDKSLFTEAVYRCYPDCRGCDLSKLDKRACVPLLSVELQLIRQFLQVNRNLFSGYLTVPEFSFEIIDTGSSSYSMNPAIERGDIVACSYAFPFAELKERDIVFISKQNSKERIVHRIIKKVDSVVFITKGDNVDEEDKVYLSEQNYDGKIIKIIKKDEPMAKEIKSWRDV